MLLAVEKIDDDGNGISIACATRSLFSLFIIVESMALGDENELFEASEEAEEEAEEEEEEEDPTYSPAFSDASLYGGCCSG